MPKAAVGARVCNWIHVHQIQRTHARIPDMMNTAGGNGGGGGDRVDYPFPFITFGSGKRDLYVDEI